MTVAQSEKVPVVAELKNEGPAISSLHRDEVIFTYNKRPTRASRGFRLQSMCCGTVVVYRSIAGGSTHATRRREFEHRNKGSGILFTSFSPNVVGYWGCVLCRGQGLRTVGRKNT
jgi:hypothetical protein